VSTHARTVLIRNGDIVGAYRHETAISDFQLTMQLDEEFCLPAVLGAITSAAEYKNHGMLTLQFRELTTFGRMVGELVVREERAGHNIGSHNIGSFC